MLLNKLTRLVLCSFFLIPAVTYANVTVKIEPKVVDSSDSSAYIQFSGQEAKNLWEYLEKIQKSGNGFVLGEAKMGVSSLTSPFMTCSKFNHNPYGNNLSDKDSHMYDCFIHLNSRGLPTVTRILTGVVMIKTPHSRQITDGISYPAGR